MAYIDKILDFLGILTICQLTITGVFFLNLASIVNALYWLRITDQLLKSYAFTRVVRSQSTLQRLIRRQI
jgi:hypothetical protein